MRQLSGLALYLTVTFLSLLYIDFFSLFVPVDPNIALVFVPCRPADLATMQPTTTTVGVLALQGGFAEHVTLVRRAAQHLDNFPTKIDAIEVRTEEELRRCDALIIPGGESTTISFVAAQSGLLEPLREFVKCVHHPPRETMLRINTAGTERCCSFGALLLFRTLSLFWALLLR